VDVTFSEDVEEQ